MRPNSQPEVQDIPRIGSDGGLGVPRLIAIGNFDGVHRGHQYLVAEVLSEARKLDLKPSILTFDPHPAAVLGRPVKPPLTGLERKLQLLRELSPELDVLVEPFGRELAQMTPRAFAEQVLVHRHAARRVLVGENFRFGRDRAGTLETLQLLGQELGFSAHALGLLQAQGDVISSSRVRALLLQGDVAAAAALLGRCHAVHGTVKQGQQLGRTLGFPTANLHGVSELFPANGVYACRVQLLGDAAPLFDGVCNLGLRPTLDGSTPPELRLEVHLLGVDRDLYDRELRVEFVARIRDERRFAGIEMLRSQIALDVEVARAQLRSPS